MAFGLLVVRGAPAFAHWEEPGAIVADLNGSTTRPHGVERAERDPNAQRLLVIRVGDGWYELPEVARITQAAAWLERWRHNVPQGIVAVLDARTDKPVVRFGAGGRITAAPRPE